MTNPLVDPSGVPVGFEGTLRDGAVPEAELAAAIRARPARAGHESTGPVRWVRAADAVAELSSTSAERGIDLHREVAHRLRSAPAAMPPVIADRIRAAAAPIVRAVLPSRAGAQLDRSR